MDVEFMEKRASKRVTEKLPVRFPGHNTFYSGTVTDLSETGMFISSELYFPMKSEFEMLVLLKEDVLRVPVKITRIVKTGDMYEGMGVELLDLPKKYLEHVIRLNVA
ncbi:MAG TPA: PilZ domain-containing protein [bacterium]|nr:PilZ domain-containing protein [bacterium]